MFYLVSIYHQSESTFRLRFKTVTYMRAIDISAYAHCDNVFLEFEKPFEDKDLKDQTSYVYKDRYKRFK